MNTPDRTMSVLRTSALCLLLGAASCTTPSVVEAEEVPQRHKALTNEYMVFDNASELAEWLYLEQVTENPNASPRVVQFNIRNTSSEPHTFLYRVRWLDAYGIEIKHSTAGWQRQSILGQERLNLPGVAPSPAAVDYRLVLRLFDDR